MKIQCISFECNLNQNFPIDTHVFNAMNRRGLYTMSSWSGYVIVVLRSYNCARKAVFTLSSLVCDPDGLPSK